MSTDDLINDLTSDLSPVRAGAPLRRLALATAIGAAGALAALLVAIGTRPDLSSAVVTGAFWMKASYTTGLAVAAFLVVERLARPVGGGGLAWLGLAALAGLAALLAGVEMIEAPATARMHVWMGHSAILCLPRIVGLSLPTFAAVLWAMRTMAPTRLRLAGFAAGIVAGSVGATVYGLSCVESTASFLASWYSLGVLIVGGLGALLGPRLLRW